MSACAKAEDVKIKVTAEGKALTPRNDAAAG
jgi:hypothetical protein